MTFSHPLDVSHLSRNTAGHVHSKPEIVKGMIELIGVPICSVKSKQVHLLQENNKAVPLGAGHCAGRTGILAVLACKLQAAGIQCRSRPLGTAWTLRSAMGCHAGPSNLPCKAWVHTWDLKPSRCTTGGVSNMLLPTNQHLLFYHEEQADFLQSNLKTKHLLTSPQPKLCVQQPTGVQIEQSPYTLPQGSAHNSQQHISRHL